MITITELAETITPKQIRKLESVFRDFSNNAVRINTIKYWQADRVFHNLLLSYARNSLVKRIDENYQILSRASLGGLLRTPQETLPEHKRIIQALRAKDRDAAIEAVQSHLEKTKLLLQETVKKLQKLGVDPGSIPIDEVVQNSSKK
jgi:DNA-binding GntR family transcriptional regulator